MKIAYFVNQYPKVSHTFIRREILALERRGFEVLRVALRGWDTPVPDDEDRRERDRTQYVLRNGPMSLVLPMLRCLLSSPARFFAALACAMKMSRVSRERSLVYAATAATNPLTGDISKYEGASAQTESRTERKTVITRALLGSDAGLYGAARAAVLAG